MIQALWRILLYNTVLVGLTLAICKLPADKACKLDGIKITGTKITEITAGDFSTCAMYCMWSEVKCNGITFESSESEGGEGSCMLFSKVTNCEVDQPNWTSSYKCYSSQSGELYKWEMFDNLRRTVDGSYGMTEGSHVVLTCTIPRLNDLFINTDITYRWYKRTLLNETKIEVTPSDQKLRFNPVQRPSPDQSDDGFYSCEIIVFSNITIRSPEKHLSVVYLAEKINGPQMTEFSGGDKYVVLDCTPPDSNPPAVVEWFYFREHRNNHERISKAKKLNYVIVDGNLVILNPTKKTAQGYYFCKAKNMMLTVSVESNPVRLYCLECTKENDDYDYKADVPKNWKSLMERFAGTNLEDGLTKLKDKIGVWSEEEKIFRCLFDESFGAEITWTFSGDSKEKRNSEKKVTEGDGVDIMEGNQVLMLSPEKILELQREGVKGVACSTSKSGSASASGSANASAKDSLKIAFPLPVEDFPERTFMLNLNPDLDQLSDILSAVPLFQEDEILRDKEKGKYLFASHSVPSNGRIGDTYLDILALRGENCGEYKLLNSNCHFENVALGKKEYNSSCDGITAHCKLKSLSKTTYWINDTRLDCKLKKINDRTLNSINVLQGQLVNLTLNEENEVCLVSSQLLLQELEDNQSYYETGDRLNSVLIILTQMSESTNVSSDFRKRAKNLRLAFMKNVQPEDGVRSTHGEKVTRVLWEVQFPLTEETTLDFPLAQGVKETEITVTLPRGINEVPSLAGPQSFIVSLYHDPETDFNSKLKDKRYVSKLVDVEPPTKLSGLKKDQEISIGIRLTDKKKFSLSYHPLCYWYDVEALSWTTDGVTTTFSEDGTLECNTTHLTAFSALMNTGLPPPHDSILSYLTYVCGGLSCLALVLTLVALTWFKDIRRSPSNKIHICLATTMLIALLLFLTGAKRYENMNEHLCKAIAIGLHYVWLSVFMWTVVESYNLWLLFIRILQARSSRFIMKLAIVVFVIPGLIVGLTAGISYDSYSDENYCLLRHSNENNIPMLYFAFYLPIGVSIIVNGGIFIAVIAKIFKKGRYQHFESKVQKVISQLKAVCTLSCVLGLTWVLGFLVFEHPAHIVFHYLFTVCNTLQGVLIFIFHCAIKPDIYQKWLYFFCNIGKESKSTPSSRSNTPTKSRLDLFTGMFQKRSSIVTLSTTVTKLSLTKQLTRQRTDSKDSLTAGMQTAVALMKKASLEPLQEKDSSSLEPVKIVRKKMLSSRSSLGDQSGHDLTPPGDPVPSYLEFLEAQQTNTNNPKRSTLPTSFVNAQTKIKDAMAAISPERYDGPKRKEVATSVNKDKVIIAGKKIIKSQQMRVEEQNQQAEIELSLEQRLSVVNSSSPDSSSSGKRSASPLDLIRGRGKITPTPPPQSEVVKLKRKQTLKQTPKAEIDQLSTLKNGAKFKARLTPKTSLEIKPQTPITTKLSQLEEWIL